MSKSNHIFYIVLILMLTLFVGASMLQAHTPPDHAKVYFIGLKDGAVAQSPVKVKFGIKGFGITPLGPISESRGGGSKPRPLCDG